MKLRQILENRPDIMGLAFIVDQNGKIIKGRDEEDEHLDIIKRIFKFKDNHTTDILDKFFRKGCIELGYSPQPEFVFRYDKKYVKKEALKSAINFILSYKNDLKNIVIRVDNDEKDMKMNLEQFMDYYSGYIE